MMETNLDEKVNLTKAVISVTKPIYWVKCLMYGLGIFTIVAVGYTFWRAYRKQLPTTTQTGNITNHNYNVKQTFGCMRMPQVLE